MAKLFNVRFELLAEATVSIVMDAETFQALSEDELKAIAIAKAQKSQIYWECKDYETSDFEPPSND